ncbi:unnamed protein product [Porites evermanni]|uniref:LamG-like jellyroll fold domain-containing protein n=1 Tax=Porites evermanni TaxID=104178 RepID=A0ABN8QZ12_9CNID|nr:unnamed protein product [Porites evermanni]
MDMKTTFAFFLSACLYAAATRSQTGAKNVSVDNVTLSDGKFVVQQICTSGAAANEITSLKKEVKQLKEVLLQRLDELLRRLGKDESSSGQWDLFNGLLSFWRLNGMDGQVSLKGSARYEKQDGRTALYLDGSSGAFAETPSLPIHRTSLTIAVWIKMKSSGAQYVVYGDWSYPWSFRVYIAPSSHFCADVRNIAGKDIFVFCTRDTVVVNKWTHLAMTWGRTQGTVRLFMNGEMNVSKIVTSNSKDFMNSGHSVFDIGLKRDSRTTAHAYFSDLMVFRRELRFSPIKNVNEIKEYLVLNHPLSKDSVGTVGV